MLCYGDHNGRGTISYDAAKGDRCPVCHPRFKSISGWQRDVHKLAVEKGWYDPPKSFGEYIALIHSEASEALEAYRCGIDGMYFGDDDKPEGVPSELADVIIRVMDFAEHLGIDLEEAMRLKHEYNATRSHRHGGKTL
jgi:NTP pyrophosphatase (non-canonical NTP hydrolase)